MSIWLFAWILTFSGQAIPVAQQADPSVGQRPYEMEWAHRDQDVHRTLVDFEDPSRWNVQAEGSEARFERSREQQIWGQFVGKLTYRATGNEPVIQLSPSSPLPVPEPFDSINLWLYGNNWAFAPDASTPPVQVLALFKTAQGGEIEISLGPVGWCEWWLMHRRLSSEQQDALKEKAFFLGFKILDGTNKEDRVLFFDNLSVYEEELKPLSFLPRPQRNLIPWPGQSQGNNTGPETLPFPTREETILPDCLNKDFKNTLIQVGQVYEFSYTGSDGTLVYRYEPKSGKLDDLTATWQGHPGFLPLSGGEVLFATPANLAPPQTRELISCEKEGDLVVSRWTIGVPGRSCEVSYAFRLWQKSLVIDVIAPSGEIGELLFGSATGIDSPRLASLPFLNFAQAVRPCVLVMGSPDHPLFMTEFLDWYRSNASELFAVNDVQKDQATLNGGCRYLPKTDGKRNDCFERIFLTVSPSFEEVLPNIPNPPSPWMHEAGKRVWNAHGASDRKKDFAFWKNIARHGMTEIALTDHETGWRDGGESFTFRTRTAPAKGGDESQVWYATEIQKLGFLYGIYNNYTDFSPVNEHWDEDLVGRLSDGQWRTAWPRCYNPKPSRAVEFEARLAPIIEDKFHLSTAYCDVHTAVTPWAYCDYDARVPGAGTFAAVYYAYGEIMLHQKKTWGGPVYSEGGQHWTYCGLTDGNYGQDNSGQLFQNPWLVDFDLRKLHPLCCNFGMGNLEMFYGYGSSLGSTEQEIQYRIDRFLAATVAFGHTGYLITQKGIQETCRSYFMLQQLHANYAQEKAREIQYADERGEWMNTTQAVATGAYRRNQIFTQYSNGLVTVVNGHPSERLLYRRDGLDLSLPPNGFLGYHPLEGKPGQFDLWVLSSDSTGSRTDYGETPAYLYADGRGRFTRFPRLSSDGALIALIRDQDFTELIPVKGCSTFGVRLSGQAAQAVALDEAGNPMGSAETRTSRGFVYVLPVPGAFSYLLKKTEAPPSPLKSSRWTVAPGEEVLVEGRDTHRVSIPSDLKTGQLFWVNQEGSWIDFWVAPLAEATVGFKRDHLEVTLKSNLDEEATGEILVQEAIGSILLKPGEPGTVSLPVVPPQEEGVSLLDLDLKVKDLRMSRAWCAESRLGFEPRAEIPGTYQSGQCLRQGQESGFDGTSGANCYEQDCICAGIHKKGIAMHPPWVQGVGYSFLLLDPVKLPQEPASFRASVGKRDGCSLGDGIFYKVILLDEQSVPHELASQWVTQHEWKSIEADLSSWAGQSVRLKLVSDVGTKDNSEGDWAAWADQRIESPAAVLLHKIEPLDVDTVHERGPLPCPPMTARDIRNAQEAWLHMEAIGLEGGPPYVTTAIVNGLKAGDLPNGGGDEARKLWADVSVPLSLAVIQRLNTTNLLSIENPGQDFFKARRFWIELKLKDGQKVGSLVNPTVYTQPGSWVYAEGVPVPHGTSIRVEIRFDGG